MTNYYVVFVSQKHRVCNSRIRCQRRVIFYKGGLYKVYTFRDEAMLSWMLYLPIWKRPNGSVVGLSSLTLNCGHEDKKQMEKCSSAMHIYFIILVITTLIYVIVIE